MTKSIITVSREFGSGGRTIAHKVAERLGVPYYDKELIKAVAEKTGFDPKFIEERGEYIFRMMLRIASGDKSKSEQHGYGQNEFVPWQIGAIT